MLAHPTLDQLHALGLHGLAKGFKDLEHNAEARSLDHAEWLGLLLEYELTLRRQKQFETRARVAKLRHPASVEDVNYQSHRGLDRALFLKLAACDWIAERRSLLITGRAASARVGSPAPWPQGVPGKSLRPLYPYASAVRRPRHRPWRRPLRPAPALARAGQTAHPRRLGPETLTPNQARDLLEIVEDRYDKGSIIITSQVPVARRDLNCMTTSPTPPRCVIRRHRIELAAKLAPAAVFILKSTCAEARLAAPSARRPWITAGSATAQWKARSARRYPPPPKRLRSSKSNPGLTNGSGQNIIAEIREADAEWPHQIGIPAGFKSESVPASPWNACRLRRIRNHVEDFGSFHRSGAPQGVVAGAIGDRHMSEMQIAGVMMVAAGPGSRRRARMLRTTSANGRLRSTHGSRRPRLRTDHRSGRRRKS